MYMKLHAYRGHIWSANFPSKYSRFKTVGYSRNIIIIIIIVALLITNYYIIIVIRQTLPNMPNYEISLLAALNWNAFVVSRITNSHEARIFRQEARAPNIRYACKFVCWDIYDRMCVPIRVKRALEISNILRNRFFMRDKDKEYYSSVT